MADPKPQSRPMQRITEVRFKSAIHLAIGESPALTHRADKRTAFEWHPVGVLVTHEGKDGKVREKVVPFHNVEWMEVQG